MPRGSESGRRAFLDVNVLIALLDSNHIHHALASDWLATNASGGWASCPLTQNGCLRIMAAPSYINSRPPAQIAERLAEAVAEPIHEFWPDDISLLTLGALRWDRVLSPRHITDLYLLAMAVRHGGRLVTLDRSISVDAVPGATPRHLVVIGARA